MQSADPGDGSTAPVVERLYREAIEELQKLGASDRSYTSDLLLCYRNLYLALFRQNRDDDAAAVMRECLPLHEKALGAEHEHTLGCVLHLAVAMIPRSQSPLSGPALRQRYEAIVALLQPVLAVLRRTPSPKPDLLSMCCRTLAGCYLELGREAEGKQMEALLEPPPKSWSLNAKEMSTVLRTTGFLLAVGVVAAVAMYGLRGSGRLPRFLREALG
jgi:hypothetical protein